MCDINTTRYAKSRDIKILLCFYPSLFCGDYIHKRLIYLMCVFPFINIMQVSLGGCSPRNSCNGELLG